MMLKISILLKSLIGKLYLFREMCCGKLMEVVTTRRLVTSFNLAVHFWLLLFGLERYNVIYETMI